MTAGRRLAIDYGEVRFGLAISDIAGILASPLVTISANHDIHAIVNQILKIVSDEDVKVIYIGLPLHLSGAEGESALKARAFAQQLRSSLPSVVAIRMIDERLSTRSALKQAREAGNGVNRENVDQLAAVMILENALHAERSQGDLAGIPL